MVRRERHMVVRSAPALALSAALLSGCAQWQSVTPIDEAQCPTVSAANAWVNAMPRTDRKAPNLIVSITFDAASNWQLIRHEGADPRTLFLTLQPREIAAVTATSYREPVRDPARTSVKILCDADVAATVERIETVY